MYEDLALFIDFENIRYSMLNIQRREPDPQELIAIARRYGTVMVARAYADWSRQPEAFKGSLTAAMIDRADCPAKQRNRIRQGNSGYNGNPPSGPLGPLNDQISGTFQRGNTGALPAIMTPQMAVSDPAASNNRGPEGTDFESDPQNDQYQNPPTSFTGTGPLSYNTPTFYQQSGNTDSMPAVSGSSGGSITIQSTVDLNMLMDIIETVFDRPSISTFVLMTGDKDFTRISARLKLRLNKTVIIVGIPGTVSRDLVSSASQFVPLLPHTSSTFDNGSYASENDETIEIGRTGNTGALPAIGYGGGNQPYNFFEGLPGQSVSPLDPDLIQFLDHIDRNWPWRTISSIAHFLGDPGNPKNRFRGRLNRDSARELLNTCIQQNILLLQTDMMGSQELHLNRAHPGVADVIKRL